MSACSVELKLDGKLTSDQVENEIKAAMSNEDTGWSTIRSFEVRNLFFDSENEAHKYCSKNCSRRQAIAVRYKSYDHSQFDKQEVAIRLKRQISDARNKYEQVIAEINDGVKNAMSKTVVCDKCESNLNRSYLKNSDCPLCGHDLKSEAEKFRVKKYFEDVINLKNELEQVRADFADKPIEFYWMVFGMAVD